MSWFGKGKGQSGSSQGGSPPSQGGSKKPPKTTGNSGKGKGLGKSGR